VFKWYQSDFGQTEGEVLAFVAKFFPEGSAEQNIISNYLTRYRTPHTLLRRRRRARERDTTHTHDTHARDSQFPNLWRKRLHHRGKFCTKYKSFNWSSVGLSLAS
jgi:hypothetical protein